MAVVFYKDKIDLNSYLRPIVKELSNLNKKPLLVIRNNVQVAISRVTALYVCGDGVQCNELMNFAGHTSKNGCRFCITGGEHRSDAYDKEGNVVSGKHGMYFQSRNKELRSKDSLILNDKSSQYVSIYLVNFYTNSLNNYTFFFR